MYNKPFPKGLQLIYYVRWILNLHTVLHIYYTWYILHFINHELLLSSQIGKPFQPIIQHTYSLYVYATFKPQHYFVQLSLLFHIVFMPQQWLPLFTGKTWRNSVIIPAWKCSALVSFEFCYQLAELKRSFKPICLFLKNICNDDCGWKGILRNMDIIFCYYGVTMEIISLSLVLY